METAQHPPEDFSALASAALRATGEEERSEAVQKLQHRSGRQDLDAALALSRSEQADERRLGADILGQLGTPERPFRDESVPVLVRLLSDADPSVVEAASASLGHLDAAEAGQSLLDVAEHPSPSVRKAVAVSLPRTLLDIDPAGTAEALISLSRDPDADVRDWATFELATTRFGEAEDQVHEALRDRLQDEDPDVRSEALAGLARFRDPAALESLLSDLEGDEVNTLHLEAAAEFADPRLCEPLRRLQARHAGNAWLEEAIRSCCEPATRQ